MHTQEGGSSAPSGGQFKLGGGRVGATAHKTTHPRVHKAAAPKRPTSLGFNGKSGAGYGIKGGDARVRTLQSVLNRFGLKDADGQELKPDGKFGPRTTAAVKKLQQAMGMDPTGKVDEAFIKKVAAAHSLADLKPKKPATRSVTVVRRATTKPYGDVSYADPGYLDDKKPRYPIDAEHVMSAWTYINQEDNAKQYTPEQLRRIKARIRAAMKKHGHTVSDDSKANSARARLLAGLGLIARSGPLTYNRCYALDDIQISRSGDGRTVEAYAAMFDQPYEVRDQHGHYMEKIERSAFNRTLNGAGKNAICIYNHGMTVHGTPDGMASLPLGNPLEIKPDGRGLLTVTRYNKGPWADSVLESIRNGDIKAQSFRGGIFRSSPMGSVPRRRKLTEPLPVVTRHELGLTDYGPTPVAVNDDAAIVAVRSAADILAAIQHLDPDEQEELLRALDLDATPDPDGDEDPDDEEDLDEEVEDEDLEDEGETATSEPIEGEELGAEDPPAEQRSAAHSGRQTQSDIARRIRLALITRRSAA